MLEILAGNQLIQAGFLLAARKSQGSESGMLIVFLVILAVLIGGAIGIAAYVNKVNYRRRYDSHPSLFSSLCKLHELSRGERSLLKSIGTIRKLKEPAIMFIEPRWLDPYRLPNNLKSEASNVKRLKEKLFAEA